MTASSDSPSACRDCYHSINIRDNIDELEVANHLDHPKDKNESCLYLELGLGQATGTVPWMAIHKVHSHCRNKLHI